MKPLSKSICVIGLGTLGGFLCKYLSEYENVEKLIIVDYDIVERKNVKNSIYDYTDLGEYKTKRLKKKLENKVDILDFIHKYEEGKTVLPPCDLVIDCRDVICKRTSEIDIKLYISGRTLIFDCRKNTETKEYEGRYITELSKNEIKNAAFLGANFIVTCQEQLKKLIENQLIQKFDINFLNDIVEESINECIKNKENTLIEKNIRSSDGCNIFRVAETFKEIKKENKVREIQVLKNTDCFPEVRTIEKGRIKNIDDMLRELNNFSNIKNEPDNFLIFIKKTKDSFTIQLIKETGAA